MHGGVKFHKKTIEKLWPIFHKMIVGHPGESFCNKVSDQLNTQLNKYGLINNQSILIYNLALANQLYLGNGCSDRKNNDTFDPKGINESLLNVSLLHGENVSDKYGLSHE